MDWGNVEKQGNRDALGAVGGGVEWIGEDADTWAWDRVGSLIRAQRERIEREAKSMNTKRIIGGGAIVAGSVIGLGVLLGWGTRGDVATDATINEQRSEGVESASSRLYEVDPTHTNVIFKIRHGSVSNFYGRFNETQGKIQFDSDHFENSTMSMVVQMNSIDTHNRVRDGHLKGADFFNVRQFEEAKFQSTSITPKGKDKYEMLGKLTLQGQTKPIKVELRDIRTGTFNGFDVIGVEARFTVKRSDFGITKYLDSSNPEGGPLGDVVEVIVGIEAVGK